MAESTRPRAGAQLQPEGLSPAEALELALEGLGDHAQFTDLTVATVAGLWRGFLARVDRTGVRSLAELDTDVVADFVNARNRDGSAPSTATKHLRRWAVRSLIVQLRRAGVDVVDPTHDVELPPRGTSSIRPLTDDEIALCRLLARYPADATLKPAAWGLAEASAATSEIPAVRRTDVAPESGLVRLPGSRLLVPREATLTDFAHEQIERRLREVDKDPHALVAYEGDGKRPQAATTMVLGKVLRRAGLAGEPGVRPASIRAWIGLRVFEETGSIEEVARRLGTRSLDAAARLIGLDWRRV